MSSNLTRVTLATNLREKLDNARRAGLKEYEDWKRAREEERLEKIQRAMGDAEEALTKLPKAVQSMSARGERTLRLGGIGRLRTVESVLEDETSTLCYVATALIEAGYILVVDLDQSPTYPNNALSIDFGDPANRPVEK